MILFFLFHKSENEKKYQDFHGESQKQSKKMNVLQYPDHVASLIPMSEADIVFFIPTHNIF